MALHESRESGEISGITGDIVSNINFWFVVIITSASCLLFFSIARNLEALFSESIINNIRQNKYRHEYEKKIYKKKLEQMGRCKRTLNKFKRLYKHKGEDVIENDENYADKKMKEMVDLYKTKKKTTKQFKKFTSKSFSEKKTRHPTIGEMFRATGVSRPEEEVGYNVIEHVETEEAIEVKQQTTNSDEV
jgi:hypothetical protein